VIGDMAVLTCLVTDDVTTMGSQKPIVHVGVGALGLTGQL
jgi:hypothetical protein